MGDGTGIRVHLRDGRRFFPQPGRHAGIPGGGAKRRPRAGLPLHRRHPHHQLAVETADVEQGRRQLCAPHHRHAVDRSDRRLQMLPSARPAGHQPRRGALQRLQLPDGDDAQALAVRDSRSSKCPSSSPNARRAVPKCPATSSPKRCSWCCTSGSRTASVAPPGNNSRPSNRHPPPPPRRRIEQRLSLAKRTFRVHVHSL